MKNYDYKDETKDVKGKVRISCNGAKLTLTFID